MMIRSLLIVIVIIFPMQCFAASQEDIDKLVIYSVIVGRAASCGIETTPAVKKIGAWIDRKFNDQEVQQYKQIFLFGMMYNGKEQQEGRSPDSCAEIKRTWSKMTWP